MTKTEEDLAQALRDIGADLEMIIIVCLHLKTEKREQKMLELLQIHEEELLTMNEYDLVGTIIKLMHQIKPPQNPPPPME